MMLATLLLPLLLSLALVSDAKPFFGLDLFDSSISSSNGTSLLAALAAAHAQHSLDTLQQLADLAALAQNISSSFSMLLSAVLQG